MSDTEPAPKGVVEVPFDKLRDPQKIERVAKIADDYLYTVSARVNKLKPSGEFDENNERAILFQAISKIRRMIGHVRSDFSYAAVMKMPISDVTSSSDGVIPTTDIVLENLTISRLFIPEFKQVTSLLKLEEYYDQYQTALVCAMAERMVLKEPALLKLIEFSELGHVPLGDVIDAIKQTQYPIPSHEEFAAHIYQYMRRIESSGLDSESGKSALSDINLRRINFVDDYTGAVMDADRVNSILSYGEGLEVGHNRLAELIMGS